MGKQSGKEKVKRTREQALATRATLLEAAECVFYEKGLAGATLDEIARRSGVTRGAVYGHFENKLGLLDAIFQAAGRPLDPFAVNLSVCREQPVEELVEEIKRCWREATEVPRTARLYALLFNLCESALEAAPFFERVLSASRDAELRIEACLRRAISRSCLPADLDAQKSARVIHAALSGLLRRRLMNLAQSNLPEADVAQIVRALLAHERQHAGACEVLV
jgi:AcrR family transcriptional regulator